MSSLNYKVSFLILVLTSFVMTSCNPFGKDKKNNNKLNSLKSLFENGYYQYNIFDHGNRVTGRYNHHQLIGNEMIIKNWRWKDSLEIWEEIEDDELNGSYIFENHYVYYYKGTWGEIVSSNSSIYSEPISFLNDDVWTVDLPLFQLEISIYSESSLASEYISNSNPDLSNILLSNAVFKTGSYRYFLKFKPDLDQRVFVIKSRICENDSAILNNENQFTCDGVDWSEGNESNFKSLEELRMVKNNERNTIPRSPYSYYFRGGSNKVVVIKTRSSSGDIIDSVLSEEGEWDERVLNGIKVMDVTLPFLSDYPVEEPTEFEKVLQPTFLERDSMVYIDNRLSREIVNYDDPLYNDSAMSSILEELDYLKF